MLWIAGLLSRWIIVKAGAVAGGVWEINMKRKIYMYIEKNVVRPPWGGHYGHLRGLTYFLSVSDLGSGLE